MTEQSKSKSTRTSIRRMYGVRSPMRDGIELASDIWLPVEGDSFPVILFRTPYLRTPDWVTDFSTYFAEKGYAFVFQDVRGRGDSDGHFDYKFQEGNDGYDTVEWLASQPWCNGRVGMMGGSYPGVVQWLAARAKPPHLVCIAPTASPGEPFDETPYVGGAFLVTGNLDWCNGVTSRIQQRNSTPEEVNAAAEHRPLKTADEVLGRKIPLYRAFLEHSTRDSYWQPLVFTEEHYRNITIPAMHITGWFDGDQPGTMYYWKGMSTYSPAAENQYLIVGPWNHGEAQSGGAKKKAEMEFSSDSIIDLKELHLEFFNRFLKQEASMFDYPRVRVYVTGRNEWRTSLTYPLPGITATRFHLSSGGRANSLFGDGKLLSSKPAHIEPQDTYTYDPKHPLPFDFNTPGGQHAVDRRASERRDEVLVYTSDVLDAPVEVVGNVHVELYAASDARDTDFTASVLDVCPDERAVVLGHRVVGIIRTRYRNGYEKEELLTPGKVEKYHIDLGHIGHSFDPGHRIRIEISSSASPQYNPNQNTGNPVATDTEWIVAHQTIYHDEEHPSALVLPVVPASNI